MLLFQGREGEPRLVPEKLLFYRLTLVVSTAWKSFYDIRVLSLRNQGHDPSALALRTEDFID